MHIQDVGLDVALSAIRCRLSVKKSLCNNLTGLDMLQLMFVKKLLNKFLLKLVKKDSKCASKAPGLGTSLESLRFCLFLSSCGQVQYNKNLYYFSEFH